MTRGPAARGASRPFRRALLGLLGFVVAALLAWSAPPVVAQDGPSSPSSSPSAPAGGAEPAPAAPETARGLTPDGLEGRLRERPGAFLAMLVLRYGAIAAGVVLLALAWARRRDVRLGALPPPRASSPPGAPFPPLQAIALVLGTQVLAAAGGTLVTSAGLPGTAGGRLTWPWAFAVTAAAMGLCAWIAHRALGRARRVERRVPWPRADAARLGGGGFLVALALTFPVSLVWVLLLHLLGVPLLVQDLVASAVARDADPWFLAALLVLGVVVAPVTEELVYRGALYGSLRARVGPRVAAVVSSVLFAAVHGSWTAAAPLFVLALVLCWVYERTGSIVAPVVAHALNNASSLLPLYLVHL